MTRKDYDAFCASLPHATHVVQWGDASVWKIGGKVFAIGGWFEGQEFAVTFKCSETSFAILKELPGARPPPISPHADCPGSSASTRAPSAILI
ncbi:MAG TPA: MmcQ/YjbR family DNA-binding protein [Roseiarcus sp.]